MSRASILVLVLIISLFVVGIIPLSSSASPSAKSGYSLQNRVTVTNYGELIVNDTLFSNVNSTQTVSSITFGYPSNYSGRIAFASASYSVGGARYIPALSRNGLQITLSLSPNLQPGQTATISVEFYVVNSFSAVSSTSSFANFSAPIVVHPSVLFQSNIAFVLDKVQSNVSFPSYGTVQLGTSTNSLFSASQLGGSPENQNLTLASPLLNVSSSTPSLAQVFVTMNPSTTGDLLFQSIQRSLSPTPSGNVMVTDTIAVTNLGLDPINTLIFQMPTNSSQITFLETAEPTLRNIEQANTSSNTLPLGSVGLSLQPDSTTLIKIQYPLANNYWKYAKVGYSVSLPNTVPVGAIVGQYSVSFSAPGGFVQTSGPASLQFTNVTGAQGMLSISYRKGIGSAYSSSFPIGVTLFIVALIGMLVLRPVSKKGGAVESAVELLMRSTEDKVSGTNEALAQLKARGVSATRADLTTARSRIEELRNRTLNRIRDLRSQFQPSGEVSQASLDNVAANDREFDLTARELVNSYDQLISKRVKYETFTRNLLGNERRLQRVATTLLDAVHEFGREQEG